MYVRSLVSPNEYADRLAPALQADLRRERTFPDDRGADDQIAEEPDRDGDRGHLRGQPSTPVDRRFPVAARWPAKDTQGDRERDPL